MEKVVSSVIANVFVEGKVSKQDVLALNGAGVPIIDLMVSSLDAEAFVKALFVWFRDNKTK